MSKKYAFETLQLHVGQEQADSATDSRAVPIYQTTSYVFHNSDHAQARFGLADAGNIYGRLTNSTQDVFEKRIAALEGGVAGLATASGAAALAYTFQALAKAGDHIVSAKTIYGGTYNYLEHTFPEHGVKTTFVDPDDLQKEIVYKCERCGCVANEYRWKQQSQQGRFVAENPGAETRGFHLNTLASTFCGWKEIVQKFIVAKEQLDQGNPEGMKVWVNTELGETWEERGEQVEDTELFNRREIYDAVVPEEVLVLTAGVDVQDDRFEVEIVGWGVGKESWGIRYQKIYGDMLKEQVWEDLDAFLQTVWFKKDGTALRIISCCIDSGGHHTDQVYRFTKERYERGVWAIKGKGGAEVPYIRNPTTNNRVKTPLFIIGVDAGKALLYQRLRHNTKGPNYCHFPANEEAGYDETYFKGLTSEKMVVRFRKGRSVTVWELKDSKHKRNEPLDLRNYATAALEIANPILQEGEIAKPIRKRPAGRRRRGGI